MQRTLAGLVFFAFSVTTVLFMQNCSQNSFQFASQAPEQTFEGNKLVQCEDRAVSEAGRNTIPLVKVVVVLDNTPSMRLIKDKISQGLRSLARDLREYEVQFLALTMNHTDLNTTRAPAVEQINNRCNVYRFDPPDSNNRVFVPEESGLFNCPTSLSGANVIGGRTKDPGRRRVYDQVVERRLRPSLLQPLGNFRFSALQFAPDSVEFQNFQNQLANAIVAIAEADQPNELGLCTIAHTLYAGNPSQQFEKSVLFDELTFVGPDNRRPVVAFLTLSDENDKTSDFSFTPPRAHPDCFKARITTRDCSVGAIGTIAGDKCTGPECSFFNPTYRATPIVVPPTPFPRYEYRTELQSHQEVVLESTIRRPNSTCNLALDVPTGTLGSHKVVMQRRSKDLYRYTVNYQDWGPINTELFGWRPQGSWDVRTFSRRIDRCDVAAEQSNCEAFVKQQLGITPSNDGVAAIGGKRIQAGSCVVTCAETYPDGSAITVDVPNYPLPQVTTNVPPPVSPAPVDTDCRNRFSSSDQSNFVYFNCRVSQTVGAAPAPLRYNPTADSACSNFSAGQTFGQNQFLTIWNSLRSAAAGAGRYIPSDASASVASTSVPSTDTRTVTATLLVSGQNCSTLTSTQACALPNAQSLLDSATLANGSNWFRDPAGNCRLRGTTLGSQTSNGNGCQQRDYQLSPSAGNPKATRNLNGSCSPAGKMRDCSSSDISSLRSTLGLVDSNGNLRNPFNDVQASSCEVVCFQPPTPSPSPVDTNSRLRIYAANSGLLPATCEASPAAGVIIRDINNPNATFTSIQHFFQSVQGVNYQPGTCSKVSNGTQDYDPAAPETIYQCSGSTTQQLDLFNTNASSPFNFNVLSYLGNVLNGNGVTPGLLAGQYFVGAFITDQAAGDIQPDGGSRCRDNSGLFALAEDGAIFRQLVSLIPALGGVTLGSVNSVCRDEYGSSLRDVQKFVEYVAQNSFIVPMNLDGSERIIGVWLQSGGGPKRAFTLVSTTPGPGQVQAIGNTLQFATGSVQKGDLLHYRVRIVRSTWREGEVSNCPPGTL